MKNRLSLKTNKIKSTYIIALAIIHGCLLFGFIGKASYEYGTPESYKEGRTGLMHSNATPPGKLSNKILMISGFSISAIGFILLSSNGIIQIKSLTTRTSQSRCRAMTDGER